MQKQNSTEPVCTCEVCNKEFIPISYSQTTCLECLNDYADWITKKPTVQEEFGIELD